jgi:hypothetical protein
MAIFDFRDRTAQWRHLISPQLVETERLWSRARGTAGVEGRREIAPSRQILILRHLRDRYAGDIQSETHNKRAYD